MKPKKPSLYIPTIRHLCLIVLLIPSIAAAGLVQYTLQTDPKNPQIATVSADTSAIGVFSLAPPRTLPFSNLEHTAEILCKTESGTSKIVYGKEIQCREITWSIHFDRLSTAGADVTEQRNLYSPAGWWVLFEWGDMPRLKGYSVEICANLIKAKTPDKCRALPNLNEPPLIMAWGHSRTLKTPSNYQFSIYVDNKQQVLSEQNWAQLISQYQYLQQLLGLKGTQEKDIDIIWVGIDESIGSMGGAAGSQAFISNYVVNNNQVSQKHLSRLHWISGHEIFHMLSPFSTPLWISESLAHYYGYKSLTTTGTAAQTPVKIWESKLVKAAHANTGLYTAHEMVVNKNDMSYYGLFYNKGAAFWQELDDELKQKGSSLDSHIALLAGTSSTKLNGNFIAAIEAVLGKKEFSQLVSKYLL